MDSMTERIVIEDGQELVPRFLLFWKGGLVFGITVITVKKVTREQ